MKRIKHTKILVLILLTTLFNFTNISSIKLQTQLDLINSGIKDDIQSIEGLLNRINKASLFNEKRKGLADNSEVRNLLSGKGGNSGKNGNEFSKLRFRALSPDSSSTQNQSNTNGSSNEIDTSDSMDFTFNLSEDSIFNNNDGSQDKELERKKGIKNGNLLYNNKRIVNIETSEFSDFYYEIIKTV